MRNIWTNVAAFQLNLWMHTLTELWAWNRSHEDLCDRSDSPWDDAQRRLLALKRLDPAHGSSSGSKTQLLTRFLEEARGEAV